MHRLKKVTEQDRYGNKVIKEYEVDQKALDPTALHAKKMEIGVPEMPGAPPVAGEEFNMGNPTTHPGGPRGEDTVPAWLTPGEFVVNKEATQAFGPQIEAMNNVGRAMQQGGQVDYKWLGGVIQAMRYVLPAIGVAGAAQRVSQMSEPNDTLKAQDNARDWLAGGNKQPSFTGDATQQEGPAQFRGAGGSINPNPRPWEIATALQDNTRTELGLRAPGWTPGTATSVDEFSHTIPTDVAGVNAVQQPHNYTQEYMGTIQGNYPDPLGFGPDARTWHDPALSMRGERMPNAGPNQVDDRWKIAKYKSYVNNVANEGGLPMPYEQWAKEEAIRTARRDARTGEPVQEDIIEDDEIFREGVAPLPENEAPSLPQDVTTWEGGRGVDPRTVDVYGQGGRGGNSEGLNDRAEKAEHAAILANADLSTRADQEAFRAYVDKYHNGDEWAARQELGLYEVPGMTLGNDAAAQMDGAEVGQTNLAKDLADWNNLDDDVKAQNGAAAVQGLMDRYGMSEMEARNALNVWDTVPSMELSDDAAAQKDTPNYGGKDWQKTSPLFDPNDPDTWNVPEGVADSLGEAHKLDQDKVDAIVKEQADIKAAADAAADLGIQTNSDSTITVTGPNGKPVSSTVEQTNKVNDWFKENVPLIGNLIGDSGLLDDQGLKEMATLYLAQRLMGFSHGGALNFAAKRYLGQVDARQKAKQLEQRTIAAEERADARAAKKASRGVFTKYRPHLNERGKKAFTAAMKSGDLMLQEQILADPSFYNESSAALIENGLNPTTAKKVDLSHSNYTQPISGYDLGGGRYLVNGKVVTHAQGWGPGTTDNSRWETVSERITDYKIFGDADDPDKPTQSLSEEHQTQVLANISAAMKAKGLPDNPVLYTDHANNVLGLMKANNIPLTKANFEAMVTSAVVGGGDVDWSKVSKLDDKGNRVPVTGAAALQFGTNMENIYDGLSDEQKKALGVESNDGFLKLLSGQWDPTKTKGFSKSSIIDGSYNDKIGPVDDPKYVKLINNAPNEYMAFMYWSAWARTK